MRYYKELEVAKELAVEAGKAVLELYSKSAYTVERKEDDSPVTTADHAANAIIVAGLGAAFPDMAILAEESVDDKSRLGKDYCWLVDPLDGTKEFIKGNDEFSVNIALVFKGRPVLGVIYLPTTRELFYAVTEEGTYLEVGDGIKKLRVTNKTQELVALRSRSRVSPKLMALYAGHERIQRVVEMGSSIKGCVIARGEAEIYYSLGETMEWDTAAMEVIVTEAGGIFMQLDDTPMRYNRKNPLNQKGFYVLNNIENKLKL
jgi:3'(2'), 5'-bisphosphate nucleotidase